MTCPKMKKGAPNWAPTFVENQGKLDCQIATNTSPNFLKFMPQKMKIQIGF